MASISQMKYYCDCRTDILFSRSLKCFVHISGSAPRMALPSVAQPPSFSLRDNKKVLSEVARLINDMVVSYYSEITGEVPLGKKRYALALCCLSSHLAIFYDSTLTSTPWFWKAVLMKPEISFIFPFWIFQKWRNASDDWLLIISRIRACFRIIMPLSGKKWRVTCSHGSIAGLI